jgi:hypothetical protein
VYFFGLLGSPCPDREATGLARKAVSATGVGRKAVKVRPEAGNLERIIVVDEL